MHDTISYNLAQARAADLRHDAERDALARAARRRGRHCGPGLRCRPGLHPWALRRGWPVPGTAQAVQPPVPAEAPAR